MHDGIVFANFNDQGGPRGGQELVVPNSVDGDGQPADATRSAHLQGDPVFAFTLGGVRDVWAWRGFAGGIVFFRLRPPAGAMGRMWNMRMSQPMAGHVP